MSIRQLMMRLLLVTSTCVFTGSAWSQDASMGKEFYELAQQFNKSGDYTKARSYLERAVDASYAPAQTALGISKLENKNDLNERLHGVGLITLAANAGDQKARHIRANLLINNNLGLPMDPQEGLRQLRELMKKGSAQARFTLGQVYISGAGVKKDEALGVAYIKRAAEEGYAPAQLALGNAYSQGRYVPRDIKKALSLWKQAAKNGEPQAIGTLYKLYREGWSAQNIKPNSTLAKKYLQMGVDKENPSALATLGSELIAGKNWSKDSKRGEALLIKSADKGYAPAMQQLGSLYARGKHVRKNKLLGLWYSTEAAAQSAESKRKGSVSFNKRHLSGLFESDDGDFTKSTWLPGDPYKPYSLLGVTQSPFEKSQDEIKKAKGFKTDIEAKVYLTELAQLLNAPAVWLSPDFRTLEQLTRSNSGAFYRYIPALRKKLSSQYRRMLPAAAKAELEYNQLNKKKRDYAAQLSALDQQIRENVKLINKYTKPQLADMVRVSENRSRRSMTFRNLTPLQLDVQLKVSDPKSSYRRTYPFSLSPRGSRTLTSLRIGKNHSYRTQWTLKDRNGYKKQSERKKTLIKRRDQNLARLKANAHYQDLNFLRNLEKRVFSGDKKQSDKKLREPYFPSKVGRPMRAAYEDLRAKITSSDYWAQASCAIAQRGNREISRYLPSKRLPADADGKSAIIYKHNYYLELQPKDAKALGLPAQRYQVQLRRVADQVVSLNLIVADSDAKMFDCGCVDYTDGEYYGAMVRPRDHGYEMKILMNIKDGARAKSMRSSNLHVKSHVSPRFTLAWDN